MSSKLSGFIALMYPSIRYILDGFQSSSWSRNQDINLYNQSHDFDILIRDKGKFGKLSGDHLCIVSIVQRCL